MISRHDQALEAALSRDAIAAKVRQIIAEYSSVDVDQVREATDPHHDLGWDSLDDVEMAMELEEEFDIEIPDDFGEELKTVGHIIDGLVPLVVRRPAD